MLQKIDLSKSIDNNSYKHSISDLNTKIDEIQRQAKDLKLPIIIVFEGWGGSGKGRLINNLILPMDPRGFKVWGMEKLTEEERMRPFLWPYWNRTPGKGGISIFNKSWYRTPIEYKLHNKKKEDEIKSVYKDINSFENTLVQDGYLIIKFFLHIGKKEQKKRFKKIEKSDSMAWQVKKKDWYQNDNYDKYLDAYNEMFENTDNVFSPWHIIEAEDKKYASLKIARIVVESIENKIKEINEDKSKGLEETAVECEGNEDYLPVLRDVDLSVYIEKTEYKQRLNLYQKKLRELEYRIYSKRIPVIIAYEGWDAAGKGGNIRRLTEKLDPRGYEVIPIAAPNEIERQQHYLWRFWKSMPKDGHIAIFDRSWYGRVLVERVEGLCNEKEWKRAYREINDMEKQLANNGSVLLKFYLHIDKEEQLRRFNERQNNPNKIWKITEEDWRNREKWDNYEVAIDEMINKTNKDYAPWHVIESNDKRFARIKVLEKVIEAIEEKL